MLCKVIAVAIGLLLSYVTFQEASIWSSVSEHKFSFDKLPENVVPTHYNIELNILAWPEVKGSVSIEVDYRDGYIENADRGRPGLKSDVPSIAHDNEVEQSRVDQIVLHVNNSVQIDQVQYRVHKKNQEEEERIEIVKYYYDSERQMLGIQLAKSFEPGSRGYLEFKFTLDTRHITSLDEKKYSFGGSVRRFIANRFIPTGARYMMPCFDEPQYKTTFQLSLQHKNAEDVLSNTPVLLEKDLDLETKITEFKETPKMSIHMLAFVVGEFDYVERKDVGHTNILVRVYTPPGLSESAEYALDMACMSIKWMEDYTEYGLPLEKFDIVIAPGQERDNYENWGLASIRANQSLFDKEEQPDLKITIGVNVAHVVVHQWFANLITVSWWDDLWITEGVAAQKAYEILLKGFPEYQSEYFVRLSSLSGVLQADSHNPGLHALSPDKLVDSKQIYDIYDPLTFMKSASLIQLIQNDLGEEKFKRVLQSLLKNNAYGNVDKYSLIRAIKSVDSTKDELYLKKYSSILHSPSYPIINVDIDDKLQVKLTIEKVNADLHGLGLVAQFNDASGNHNTVISRVNNLVLEKPGWFDWDNREHWFKLNPNPDISTYFRVRYNNTRLKEGLRRAILYKYMGPLDRLNIIEDAAGLVKAGEMDIEALMWLYRCYYNEKVGAVVLGVLSARKLIPRIWVEVDYIKDYRRYEFSMSENQSFADSCVQLEVITELFKSRKEVRVDALAKFDKGPIPEYHLRQLIYNFVVMRGNPSQVNKLLELLSKTNSNKERERLNFALTLPTKLEVITAWPESKKAVSDALAEFDEGPVPEYHLELPLRQLIYNVVAMYGSRSQVNKLLKRLTNFFVSENNSVEEQERLIFALTLSNELEVLSRVSIWFFNNIWYLQVSDELKEKWQKQMNEMLERCAIWPCSDPTDQRMYTLSHLSRLYVRRNMIHATNYTWI